MSEFSFEKYIDEATKTENGDLKIVLPVRAHDSAIDGSAENLDMEARMVAQALSLAEVPYGGSVVRYMPLLGISEVGGWNLTELAPMGPVGRVLKMRQDWLALTHGGELYRCVPLAPDMRSLEGVSLLNPGGDLAEAPYLPEHGTVLNNETIRYGLARLVVRHQLEFPEDK